MAAVVVLAVVAVAAVVKVLDGGTLPLTKFTALKTGPKHRLDAGVRGGVTSHVVQEQSQQQSDRCVCVCTNVSVFVWRTDVVASCLRQRVMRLHLP